MVGLHFEIIRHEKYRYRLVSPYQFDLNPDFQPVWTRLPDGWAAIGGAKGQTLLIREGYCWDGASGPAVDTMNFAEGSLVHDALYQLVAARCLPYDPWKKLADLELYRVLRMHGMNWIRANRVYWAMRFFGRARDKYDHPEPME